MPKSHRSVVSGIERPVDSNVGHGVGKPSFAVGGEPHQADSDDHRESLDEVSASSGF